MSNFTKAFSVLALAGVSLFGASAANAAHSYTFTGSVNVFKGIPLTCFATVVKTPDHDPVTGLDLDTGTVEIDIGPGEPNCALLDITSNPMDYEQGPPDIDGWKDMVIYGLRVETITIGNCYGNITVQKRYNPITGKWEIRINTSIPEEHAGGPCFVNGTLTS